MKKFYFLFFFSLFILLLSQSISFAQQPLSGKVDLLKGQQLQSDSLNDFGTLWGWGENNLCQLGDGTTIDRYEHPIQIGNETNWKMISCGRDHSAGIKKDGTLWVCGNNYYGELGTGTTDSSSTFIQHGTENNWKYVVTGSVFTLALKNDGSLWGWGNNAWGQFADSTFEGSLLPVKSAEILWGKIKNLYAGDVNGAAITNDGSLWMWGINSYGNIGDGTQKEKCYPFKVGNTGEWLTVGCNSLSTVAIKTDGTLWRWGCNYDGHLREGTGAYNSKPKKYGTDTNWAAISISIRGAIALKKDGTLWAWGENYYGAVGDGTTDVRNTPVQIGTDDDWNIISGSWFTSFATKKDGSLWSWGLQYQDGDSIRYFLVPTRIENMADIIHISGTGYGPIMFIGGHLSKIPEIVTLPISKITSTSAVSGGNVISDDNEEIIRGICYSTTSNPTISDNKTIDGGGLGKFQSDMTKLDPFTRYFVRAYATNSSGTGYGQEETFVTKLQTPILIDPENKKTNVPYKVTFLWKNVPHALNYRIQLSQNDKFSPYVFGTKTNDTSFDYKNIQLNTQYYWRVQALNGADSSDWSEVWTFNSSKFDPQDLISPADNSINIPIDCQLNWDKNGIATSYIIQVSNNDLFSEPVIDTCVSKTSLLCEKLDMFTYYHWRVRCLKGIDSSEWSPTWHFTTLMDSVNLNIPMDMSKNMDIEQNLSWEKGIYEKDYRLQVARDESFNNTTLDNLLKQKYDADITNLKNYTKYFWRVRNESGDILGYWSKNWQFRTRMADVILIYPENEQTGLDQKIKFIWSIVFGAEYYQLQISKNDNFTDLVYSKDSITTTEHFVPNLEPDILYYWRVRVWNTETLGTAYWSEVWTFRTGETGVKDVSEFILIIPNPAGDFITVTIERWSPSSRWTPSSTNVIQIYNTLGERVLSASAQHAVPRRIDISDLPKGMYFVKVGSETSKFMKK